jgi:hypothetical protein
VTCPNVSSQSQLSVTFASTDKPTFSEVSFSSIAKEAGKVAFRALVLLSAFQGVSAGQPYRSLNEYMSVCTLDCFSEYKTEVGDIFTDVQIKQMCIASCVPPGLDGRWDWETGEFYYPSSKA